MVGGARIQQRQAGAVEMNAVEVLVVDILARLAAVAVEVEQAVLGVDRDDGAGPVTPAGDGVLEFAGAVVEVEMAPAGALRPPDHLVGVFEVTGGRNSMLRSRSLRRSRTWLAGVDVQRAEFDSAGPAIAADEAQLVGVLPQWMLE